MATTTNAAADTVIITMAMTTNAVAVTAIITMAMPTNAAADMDTITTTTIMVTIMVTAKAVALAAVAEDCLKYSSFRIDGRRACDENIVASPNLFSSNSAGVVKMRSAVGNVL